MFIISLIGLIVNVVVALIMFKGGDNHNLNMRGAFIHVLGEQDRCNYCLNTHMDI